EPIRIALEFKRGLEAATLEIGGLQEEELLCLRNPPKSVIEIPDKDVLLSLKMFLSTTTASDKVYDNLCHDLQDVIPDQIAPLSHYLVKKKVAELTGVVPIIQDMCPNSCVAYTGPFAEFEKCPICKEDQYNVKGS
ncbi:hypothetical protein BDQ12DRAFT_619579, partial [Crucibulum laeve]